MAFDDDELSAHDGEPIELYEFVGSAATYRYTDSQVAQTFEANSYTPATISRGSIPGAGSADAGALTVRLPSTDPLVLAYGLGNPPRSLTLRLLRKQVVSGQAEELWRSSVTAPRIDGRWAEFQSPSRMADRLGATIPAVSFQRLCNHFLYDEHCRVARTDYDLATTVASVVGTTVTVASIGGQPDAWFTSGEIVRNSDGERRMIVGQVGAVLELASPFRALSATDAVTLYAGCDHLVEACRDKFNNVVNFGGHPTVPRVDLFQINIRGLRSA